MSWRGCFAKEESMSDDPSVNDPRRIWQSQPTEASSMTAEKIQRKARELRAKTRRELLGNIAVPLMAAGLFGFAGAHDPVQRPIGAFAIVWALAGQYVIHRGMWAATLP